jgi:hypothetical protein
MDINPDLLDNVTDREEKKKILQAENKMLRANLKRMSGNVTALIEKMRQQSLRKTKGMFHPEDLLVDESQDETVSTVASHIAGQKRGNLLVQQSLNLSVNASTHGS